MAVTALQSLELLERSYAFDGVEPPVFESDVMRWVGTSLGIAGVPLLVGAGELEEIIETPAITLIPGTRSWVLGVAAHKGGLLPVICGDTLFRREPYKGKPRDYCMVIRRPGFYFGITISHVERDLHFPIEERDMEHPVDTDFARYSLGGFTHGDRFLAILDVDGLVADEELASAAATEDFKNEETSND
jgi:twitching motility protein PilI